MDCLSFLRAFYEAIFYTPTVDVNDYEVVNAEVEEVPIVEEVVDRYDCIKFQNLVEFEKVKESNKGEEFVYVLALQDGKYYVGYSANIKERLLAHFTGRGAKYTISHPPTHVLYVLENGSKDLEKDETLRLMKIYGRDHVRGSYWCSEHPNRYFPNIV